MLTFDRAGNIFGTTYEGGSQLSGDVFEIERANGKWNEHVLYTFQGIAFGRSQDGTNPTAGVVFDKAGNLYGTTFYGGPKGVGTVYKLIRQSDGSWKEHLIYIFQDGTDGGHPNGGLVIDAAGNLYGTTAGHSTLGSVFKLSPSGSGKWTFSVLHDFTGPDGALPQCTLVMDSAGNLYGTTAFGGETGNGVVFEVTP